MTRSRPGRAGRVVVEYMAGRDPFPYLVRCSEHGLLRWYATRVEAEARRNDHHEQAGCAVAARSRRR